MWPFKKTPNPQPGEKWYFKDNCQGPWPKEDVPHVTIVDVKEGWVRYDMRYFKDQRLKLWQFKWMYKKCPDKIALDKVSELI